MHAAIRCGRAFKDANVCIAVWGSSKASAAVLLSDTIWASAEISLCVADRKRMESAITMPSPDKRRAAAVTDIMITISFCLIGMSRKGCILFGANYFSTDLATFISLELTASRALDAAV